MSDARESRLSVALIYPEKLLLDETADSMILLPTLDP
jgi:hypothetical protein